MCSLGERWVIGDGSNVKRLATGLVRHGSVEESHTRAATKRRTGQEGRFDLHRRRGMELILPYAFLFPKEPSRSIASIPRSQSGLLEDRKVWKYSRDGCYDTKSAYRLIDNPHGGTLWQF